VRSEDEVNQWILEGRDHGISSFSAYRRWCGLSDLKSMKDLIGIMEDGSVEVLQTDYEYVGTTTNNSPTFKWW
jgi:hypothetical protein